MVKSLLVMLCVGCVMVLVQYSALEQAYSADPNSRYQVPEYEYITLANFLELKPNVRNLIVDVRSPEQFQLGRIAGAVNYPYDALMTNMSEELLNQISNALSVIIYCTGTECNLSEKAALLLKKAGATNIKIYKGGMGEWKSCHLPMEKNESR